MGAFFEKKPAPVVGAAPKADRRLIALAVLMAIGMGLLFVPLDKLGLGRPGLPPGGSLADLFAARAVQKRVAPDVRPPSVNSVGLIYTAPGLSNELGTPVKPPPGGASVGGILSGPDGTDDVTMDLPDYLRTSGGAGTIPESVARALDGVEVPDAGEGQVQGGTHGRLPRARARAMSDEVKQTLSKPRQAEGKKAFAQLASGYSRALAAVGPMAAEASAATASSLYDGMRAPDVPDRLAGAAPPFDGASLPNVHDTDRIRREARRLQAETRACQSAEAEHGASKAAHMKMMDVQASAFRGGNCRRWVDLKDSCRDRGGWGACAASRLLTLVIERCSGRRSSFMQACREYNRVECVLARACPTVAAQGCSPVDCESMIQ